MSAGELGWISYKVQNNIYREIASLSTTIIMTIIKLLMRHLLTSTCQTFSFAPSNEQNRMLTPSNPWPPHRLLGVILASGKR